MQCSRSAVATATCRGSRWLSAAGGPPLFTGGLGAAPFSTDASDGDTPEVCPPAGQFNNQRTSSVLFPPYVLLVNVTPPGPRNLRLRQYEEEIV
jgi:hypothetical protein